VVVNDLGTSLQGQGRDETIASKVVEEIRSQGGTAIADMSDISSFAGAARVVQTALDSFGRIDIIVNNAGITGGAGALEEMTEEALDRLMAVHYKGTVGTVKAAFPVMKQQHYGRIVNTVSEAAFPVPRGQGSGGPGYPAAKAAVWSATLGMARAGAAYGITVNAISPGARTRMSEGLLNTGVSQGLDLDPQHVSRVVCYLVSERAGDINGRVIHAAGGFIREYQIARTANTEIVQRLERELRELQI
jgi:NAD(P)-dependent dehydrogenase (short-subunit alcohol dehydrogenase family)